MTLTAHDLNTRFKDESFKASNWETLGDLLAELHIADHREYMFLGRKFEGDTKPIHLIPESSLKGIYKIIAVSHHIGGR